MCSATLAHAHKKQPHSWSLPLFFVFLYLFCGVSGLSEWDGEASGTFVLSANIIVENEIIVDADTLNITGNPSLRPVIYGRNNIPKKKICFPRESRSCLNIDSYYVKT